MNKMHLKIASPGSSRRAFTLVEIILVSVIIMILVGIVGPKLAGKSRTAKENATKIQMQGIKGALGEFEVHATRFPTTAEGLEALLKKPGDLSDQEWAGPYMEAKTGIIDKFGEPIKYVYPSEKGFDYDLISSGADKKFGTDDDIFLFESEDNK